MFKRRKKRSYSQMLADGIYPRGGWIRAASYVLHRIRRLPDPPHKIARGVAAGVFVCFTPFFGFHFVLATAISLAIQGNVLASLLATFFGNPITFPIIATVSVELGSWILGMPGGVQLHSIVREFSNASLELWANVNAMFTGEVAHWDSLILFFHRVFLPYLVGGILPGLITAAIFYFATRPVFTAYQARRIRRMKKRYEKQRAAMATKAGVDEKSD